MSGQQPKQWDPLDLVVDTDVLAEIAVIGERRRPAEACGALLPATFPRAKSRLSPSGRIVELPNRSSKPQTNCAIWGQDLKVALESWLEVVPQEAADRLIIWHTHPGGRVGPSQDDIRQAVPGIQYAVISLPEGGAPCLTWYSSPKDPIIGGVA